MGTPEDRPALAELYARMDAFERNYVKKSELQQIHATLELYGKSITNINERLDDLNTKFDKMELKWDERYSDLERHMYAQNERYSDLEHQLRSHDERLGALEGDMKKLLRHFGID